MSAQKKYILKMTSSTNLPSFKIVNGKQTYIGDDEAEARFFSSRENFKIYRFNKYSKRENVLRYMIVEAENSDFVMNLKSQFPSKYLTYQDITDDIPKLMSNGNDEIVTRKVLLENLNEANNTLFAPPYFPNDYDDTVDVEDEDPLDFETHDRNELKYLGAPKAWGIIGGGDSDIIIGLSDGKIHDTLPDFIGKVDFINYSYQDTPFNPNFLASHHGTSVAALAAATGDNNEASLGICYNCKIRATNYNNFVDSNGEVTTGYENLTALAQTGVPIINMSWRHPSILKPQEYIDTDIGDARNNTIQEIVEDYGTILVAGAGNESFYNLNTGQHSQPSYGYPASFENVISVSNIHHRRDIETAPPYTACNPTGPPDILKFQIKGAWSYGINANTLLPTFYGCAGGVYDPPSNPTNHEIGPTFNEHVDIVSPGNGVFNYVRISFPYYEENDITKYGGGTSSGTPLVSGTIGLMLSRDKCLKYYEVDDILKLTSSSVEYLPFNSWNFGKMGGGALQTGNAVQFVDEMNKTDGNAEVFDQTFSRFDLRAKRIKNNLTIRNTKFIENSFAWFKAENEINLIENTLIEPNSNGSFLIEIEEFPVVMDCRKSNGLNFNESESAKTNVKNTIKAYPNPSSGSMTIESELAIQSYMVSNPIGRTFSNDQFRNNGLKTFTIDLSGLPTGIYFLSLKLANGTLETKTIIKD